MVYADWLLLGLVALSVLIGLWRGFIQEVFALAVWVLAFLLAFFAAFTAVIVSGDRLTSRRLSIVSGRHDTQ